MPAGSRRTLPLENLQKRIERILDDNECELLAKLGSELFYVAAADQDRTGLAAGQRLQLRVSTHETERLRIGFLQRIDREDSELGIAEDLAIQLRSQSPHGYIHAFPRLLQSIHRPDFVSNSVARHAKTHLKRGFCDIADDRPGFVPDNSKNGQYVFNMPPRKQLGSF